MRVKFEKGMQREFLKRVLIKVNCPSLRAFLQFGFDVPYSTLKNYYSELRLLPKSFFEELCDFAFLNKEDFDFEVLEDSWGQVKGGTRGRRKKPFKRKFK